MTPVAWITGASSGIGRAVALKLAQQGYALIISGRNEAALAEVAALTGAWVLAFDVTDPSRYPSLVAEIGQRYQALDLVFFNAGDCEYFEPGVVDVAVVERMLAVNFFSMVYGVAAVLPLLRLAKNPHIVGMSSAVAYLGLPRAAAYGASKAAARVFLQALRLDLQREGIAVSVVLPGFVHTPLTAKNRFAMPGIITAERAAELIVRGIKRRQATILVPWLAVAVFALLGLLPTSWITRMVRRVGAV